MDTRPFEPSDVEPGNWQPVVAHLFARYAHIIHQAPSGWDQAIGADLGGRAMALCQHAQQVLPDITQDKANRWLGFVQGLLTVAKLIDVEIERDYTRPFFHALNGPSPTHDVRGHTARLHTP